MALKEISIPNHQFIGIYDYSFGVLKGNHSCNLEAFVGTLCQKKVNQRCPHHTGGVIQYSDVSISDRNS
jgi:hypothetical protein